MHAPMQTGFIQREWEAIRGYQAGGCCCLKSFGLDPCRSEIDQRSVVEHCDGGQLKLTPEAMKKNVLALGSAEKTQVRATAQGFTEHWQESRATTLSSPAHGSRP
ncbi:hypothetical protein LEMLEM_LOCUS1859 [Lemmus lemmus]